jgi:CspA family cold shock protein
MIKQFINRLLGTNKIKKNKEGTVKFFNKTKGFGFISLKDSEEEIFTHSTNLIDEIKENDQVTFDVEKGKKGLSAINVRLVS